MSNTHSADQSRDEDASVAYPAAKPASNGDGDGAGSDGKNGHTPSSANVSSWIKPIVPVAIIALCAEMGTSVLNNSTLPLYFTEGLGIGKDVLAHIVIPFYVAEALFKVPLGLLADKFGRKPLMLLGCMISVFTPVLLMSMHVRHGMAVPIAMLIAFGFLRMLDGFGGAALWPSLFAYVGDEVHEDKRGAAMGLLNVMYIVGLAFSFLIAGQLDDAFDPILTGKITLQDRFQMAGSRMHDVMQAFRHHHFALAGQSQTDILREAMSRQSHYFPSMYFAVFLFGLASIACVIGMKNRRSKSSHSESHEHTEEGITWQSFKEALHKIPQFMGLAFITFLGIGCIANLVKIFAFEEFHMTEQHFGLLIFVAGIVIAAIAYPLGHLSDRWGKPLSVKLGFALCAIGLWGIPILHAMHQVHEIAFVLSASVMGIGFVIAFPAWNALLTSLCDDSHRATVFSTVSTCQGIGVLAGIETGGFLYQHVAHIAPFAASAILVTMGTIVAVIVVRDSRLKVDL